MLYDLYKGDTVLCVGSTEQIAEYLNSDRRYVYQLATPDYHRKNASNEKRKIVYKYDDTEEGETEYGA